MILSLHGLGHCPTIHFSSWSGFRGPLHRSLSPSFISPSLHRSLGFEHNGSVILVGLELLSYFTAADELREEAIVASLVADAAGDDGGVDVGLAGESVDC